MNKTINIFIIVVLHTAAHVLVAQNDEDLVSFIIGQYEIIGRYPGSKKPFIGSAVVTLDNGKIFVKRTIDKKTEMADAEFIKVTADQITVLQCRFQSGKETYVGVYMIKGDLDNYPRLTGQLFKSKDESFPSGIEAWFPIIPN
ncbi:MAG TPA: hypothetical protein PK937_09655 [bacterium]|nr:hypothetical protein [bacterium]